ncbi:saccharopine dehydrogenase [Skermanella stibiiresistens SB22]|uniref:Saccharopine dehydrogenase n=1 Tax=Skermanella stibiiresistens SB22 TaxID=1385369 RepID=W9GT68_9PROT|nr:saccharopine dehydrogenase [Skermanella stibiiresistens SB22]
MAGGSGMVGRRTAQYLRAASPDVPLLIGGRDLAKAKEVAAVIGNAEGVALDLTADDLGLGGREVGAVAVFVKDDAISSLRFAQARGVPHVGISSGASEIAPEVAAYVQSPGASAVVLGAEWLVGAVTVPALEFVKDFRHVHDITIGALLDEQDTGGPAAAIDMRRLGEILPAALTRRDGAFFWRLGEDAEARFRAIDGTEMEAVAFSPFDVMGLAAATSAPNVQFNLATGVSSTRRRGEPMSTEIIIELAGEDHAGQPLRTRHAILHPEGQMPLTALGVAMVLERLIGLDGEPATPPGLYFPYQLLESRAYFERLDRIGGKVMTLDAR